MQQLLTPTTMHPMLAHETQQCFTRIEIMLDQLIYQARADIEKVPEPKAQALFETTAEVLLGLKKAYTDYAAGGEKAWE